MNARRPAFARWLDDKNEITRMFLAAGSIPNLVNLAGGLPEPSTYPVEELAGLARRAVAEHPGDALSYPPIDGLPALRDALAAKYATPALRLTRDNVLITSGGMQGLDLAGKALLDPGAVIAAQSPAYLGALDAWRPRAPSYRPFFPDRNDFDPDAALAGAQFGYAVPNFSNPTGKLVGRDARAAMVCAARATGTWLVEDDPYGALYFDAAPLPSLQELDAAHETGDGPYDGPVVYMGSLSKQLVPGLRVGWVIAAPEMIAALTVAKQGSDMCTSGLSQRIALDALEGGAVARAAGDPVALPGAARRALRRDGRASAAVVGLGGSGRRHVRLGGGEGPGDEHGRASGHVHGGGGVRVAVLRLRSGGRGPAGAAPELHAEPRGQAGRRRAAAGGRDGEVRRPWVRRGRRGRTAGSHPPYARCATSVGRGRTRLPPPDQDAKPSRSLSQ